VKGGGWRKGDVVSLILCLNGYWLFLDQGRPSLDFSCLTLLALASRLRYRHTSYIERRQALLLLSVISALIRV
jgi:hypothetical protein